MKSDDRCKAPYPWFICTGINKEYLFLNPDRVRKPLNYIQRNLHIFLLTSQNPIFTVLTVASEKLHNMIQKAIFFPD